MHLRIGTRGSKLALYQTRVFIDKLLSIKEFTYEVVEIKTTGDKITDKPLYEIGGKALFLKELEEELNLNRIDIAVHSLKDVPGVIDNKFYISGFIGREFPHDCLISFKYNSINDLETGATVGTSSPRRIAFLKKYRPDLNILNLRGNVPTRIEKLKSGEFDAIILAESGIRRLDLYDSEYCSKIVESDMIPAVGQGVICAQVKADNKEIIELIDKVTDTQIKRLVEIERGFLKLINADCDTPVACYVSEKDNLFSVNIMLSKEDFSKIIIEKFEFNNLNEISGAILAKEIKAKLQ